MRSTLGKVGSRLPVRRTADGHWTGPFIMASYNTRIVRRSNALLGWAYGRSFRYQEVTDFGRSLKAPVMATGMTAGLLGLGLQSGARVLLRMGNRAEFPFVFFGAIAAGLAAVLGVTADPEALALLDARLGELRDRGLIR